MTYAEKTEEVRIRVANMWAEVLGCETTDALLELTKNYFNIEFARPFIIRDIEKGLDPGFICERYGITYDQLRYFKCQIGICSHPRITKRFPNYETEKNEDIP